MRPLAFCVDASHAHHFVGICAHFLSNPSGMARCLLFAEQTRRAYARPSSIWCVLVNSIATSVGGRKGARMLNPGASKHVKDGKPPTVKRHRDAGPFSIFVSPSSQWKDYFRSQVHMRQQRRRHSPFVQRAYDHFVATHPHLQHCGLPERYLPKRYRASWMPHQKQPRPLPAFSYLKDRLQKKYRPHATAKRNSLLCSRHQTQPLEVLSRSRARRRSSSRPAVCLPSRLHLSKSSALSSDASQQRQRAAPKRHTIQRISRFSRR